MPDWLDNVTPKERKQWDEFVDHSRREVVEQMADSAMVISLLPEGEPDVKFAVELGFSIMLDKPIIAIVRYGVPIPRKLRKIVDHIVSVADMDTEAGQLELSRKLAPIIKRYTK